MRKLALQAEYAADLLADKYHCEEQENYLRPKMKPLTALAGELIL